VTGREPPPTCPYCRAPITVDEDSQFVSKRIVAHSACAWAADAATVEEHAVNVLDHVAAVFWACAECCWPRACARAERGRDEPGRLLF
jgi:hypothetical protein